MMGWCDIKRSYRYHPEPDYFPITSPRDVFFLPLIRQQFAILYQLKKGASYFLVSFNVVECPS